MTDDPLELGRFAEPSLYILASLTEGPKHGYAIMTDVEAISGHPMGPGTLYGALARLERRGLIEALEPVERRRPYRLTGLGEATVRAQLQRLAGFAATGLDRLRETDIMTTLVRLYPQAWRDRYGDEFLDLLDTRPPGSRDRLDILLGAVDARLNPEMPGHRPSARPASRALRGRRLAGLVAIVGGALWASVAIIQLNAPLVPGETYKDGTMALLIGLFASLATGVAAILAADVLDGVGPRGRAIGSRSSWRRSCSSCRGRSSYWACTGAGCRRARMASFSAPTATASASHSSSAGCWRSRRTSRTRRSCSSCRWGWRGSASG